MRERFEESYTAVPVPARNKKGYTMKYVYYAPWYYWDLPRGRLQREKVLLIGCSLLSLAVFLLAGVQDIVANSWKAVYLPCVLALCAHILELFGLVQFCTARYPTTQITYQDVERMMEFAPIARAICTGLAGLICLIGSIASGFSPLVAAVAALFFVCAAAPVFELHRYRKIPVRREKNTTLETMDQAMQIREE